MSRVPRACLTCGAETYNRRCRRCQRLHDSVRNALPHRQAYRDPEYRSIPLGPACVRCGATKDLTRGHKVPVIKGGTVKDGIETLCRSCNSSEGAGGPTKNPAILSAGNPRPAVRTLTKRVG